MSERTQFTVRGDEGLELFGPTSFNECVAWAESYCRFDFGGHTRIEVVNAQGAKMYEVRR